MSRPVIIIADKDEQYLAPLELKFVEELSDRADIEMITEESYFDVYFSSPRTADILIVSEELYSKDLHRHNINRIFVLTDKLEKGTTEDLGITKIYKYTSIKEIYNEVLYHASGEWVKGKQQNTEPQVILLYSPVGGSGKTTIAMGLSTCIAQNFKRVIYIDAEYIQTFHRYLSNKSFLNSEIYQEFQEGNEQVYQKIKHCIRREIFDYMPPFCAYLPSLNIKFSFFKTLISSIKASKEYDYIIVDADSVLNNEKTELIGIADKVLILTLQDKYSSFKLMTMLDNIDCSDSEKYIFVCNCFVKEKENYLLHSSFRKKIILNEYVEWIDGMDDVSVHDMVGFDGFQKLAYMLI